MLRFTGAIASRTFRLSCGGNRFSHHLVLKATYLAPLKSYIAQLTQFGMWCSGKQSSGDGHEAAAVLIAGRQTFAKQDVATRII